jgi:hypothetical protein
MPYSYPDYKRNPFFATEEIGKLLSNGCLNLFLGSGISQGFGLPEWARLIARVIGRGDDDAYVAKIRSQSLLEQLKLIDPVDTADEDYHEKVYKALYKDVKDSLLDQLPRSPLLLAVAALLTGSCRGRIQTVFTYNYDDLLEQYLKMLGYKVCTRTTPTDYSTWADVEINHVHGYLPQSWKKGGRMTELVLSEKSYRNRRAGIDEGWSACVENSFYSRPGLFLGISGDDATMLDIFARAKKKIQRNEDYHGYWIMTPDAFARNEQTIVADNIRMCPIALDKDKFPEFVFRVCQEALA